VQTAGGDELSTDLYTTGIKRFQPGDHPQYGRLTAATRPN
jgi:hypothetical protein